MQKIVIENFSRETFDLAIEPWAQVETLAPDEKVEIEYLEPAAELSFAIMDDGSPALSIVSSKVTISGKAGIKHFQINPEE